MTSTTKDQYVPPSTLTFITCALVGLIFPFIDDRFGETKLGYIALLVLETYDPTGGVIMILRDTTNVSRHITSLYLIFGVSLVVELSRPIFDYIRGKISDDQFFQRMVNLEILAHLYFGPLVLKNILAALWPFCSSLLIAGVTTIIFWIVMFPALRVTAIQKGYKFSLFLIKPDSLCIRGFVWSATQYFAHFVGRWEIDKARNNAEKTLPKSFYKYSSLKKPHRHIRLLVLGRRSFFSRPCIDLKIEEFPLNTAPPFEALSYTWGKAKPSIPMAIGDKRILVTSAVQDFLFHHRSVFGKKYIWIDALSIEQQDEDGKETEEKSIQIRLMAKIYRKASRVIVWLGPPESLAKSHVLNTVIRSRRWPLPGRRLNPIFPFLSNDKVACEALAQLFSHSWFERMWIVQEVAVGKSVHVLTNGLCIEWDTIAKIAEGIGEDWELRSTIYQASSPTADPSSSELGVAVKTNKKFFWARARSLHAMRVEYKYFGSIPLDALLFRTRLFKCGNPIDKIFAVRGMARDASEILGLGYKDSVENAFLQATRLALSQDNWFANLAFAGRGYVGSDGPQASYAKELPSWVADYASDSIIGAGIGRRPINHYPSGGVRFTADPKTIQLQIHCFDSIEEIGKRLPFRPSSLSILPHDWISLGTQHLDVLLRNSNKAIMDWYLDNRALALKHATASRISQEEAIQRFWQACIAVKGDFQENSKLSAKFDPGDAKARKIFELLLLNVNELERVFSRNTHFEGLAITEVMVEMEVLQQRFAKTTIGKRFAITSRGMMAFVPPLSEFRDVIVHVRGGWVPLILRPSQTKERTAELVGVCSSIQGVDQTYNGSKWTEWTLV